MSDDFQFATNEIDDETRIERLKRTTTPVMIKGLAKAQKLIAAGRQPKVLYGQARDRDGVITMREANSLLRRGLIDVRVTAGASKLELHVYLTVEGALLAVDE